MTSTQVKVGISQPQSLAVIRNMTRSTLSAIAFTRGFFPESSFTDLALAEVRLKQIVLNHPAAVEFDRLLHSAMSAIDLGYLQELTLCIFKPHKTDVLESYALSFDYTPDGTHGMLSVTNTVNHGRISVTHNEMAENFREMIERIMNLVSQLPPLVDDADIAFTLSFHEDRTPDSYNPTGFHNANPRITHLYNKQKFLMDRLNISGRTPFHGWGAHVYHPVLAAARKAPQPGGPSQVSTNVTETLTLPSSSDPFVTPVSVSPSPAGRSASQESREPSCNAGSRSASRSASCPAAQQPVLQSQAQSPVKSDPALGAELLKRMDTVEQLAATRLPYRWFEVAFLLLAAHVFAQDIASSRGRGTLTRTELDKFLAENCSLDLTDDFTAAALERLQQEGYISPVLSARARILRWDVCRAISPALVEQLLAHQELCSLLPLSTLNLMKAFTQDHKSTNHGSRRKRHRDNLLVA
eukprot:gene4917-3529_t